METIESLFRKGVDDAIRMFCDSYDTCKFRSLQYGGAAEAVQVVTGLLVDWHVDGVKLSLLQAPSWVTAVKFSGKAIAWRDCEPLHVSWM